MQRDTRAFLWDARKAADNIEVEGPGQVLLDTYNGIRYSTRQVTAVVARDPLVL